MLYILTLQTLKDGSKPSSLVASDSFDNACMQLHQTQAYNYANEDVVKALVEILNEEGDICKRDFFEREVVDTVGPEVEE